jgi:hypothetical protein
MDFATLLGGANQATPSPSDAAPPQNAQAPEAGGFFQKMQSDPALTQAMLMAGVRMMQGPRRGQDTVGMIGDAMAVGAATYGGQKQADQAFALKQQEEQRRNAESQSTIAQNEESVATSRQKREQDATMFPETQKQVAAEIRRARLQGDNAQADLLIKQWKSDPQRMAEDRALDNARTRAQTGQANAAAAASAASADNSKANAELTRAKTTDPGKYQTNYGGTAQAVQNRADIASRIKLANPGISEVELNQRVLEFEKSARRQDLETTFFKFASDNGFDMSQPGEADKAWAAFQNGLAVTQGRGASPTSPVKETNAAPPKAGPMPPKEGRVKGTKWNGYTWTGTGWVK